MAANSSIGNAYLNVIPKLDGDPKGMGDEFGSKMSGGLKGAVGVGAVAVGNILANMVTSVASNLGEQITKTFWNYADYEQLIGGVDTLFKDASAEVQANAQAAFATTGMSANQYMEQVTGFSASLIRSLDGDTQKAAQVADMAMRDMSDNANKMGTDMGRLTDAYQAFARGEFRLLDNLQLGYSGSREGMQQLLQDAEAISGVHYDIGNYSDVIEAIHVIQEDMGIAGTTMLEGSTTIQGSLSQLGAAWENFLTAIGDGGQTMDMTTVTQNLVTSLVAAAKNVIPAIGRIAVTVATALPGAFAEAMSVVVPQIQEAISSQFGEGAGGLFGDWVAAANELAGLLGDAFSSIADIVAQAMPAIQGIVLPVLENLVTAGISFYETIMAIVNPLLDFISANVMPVVLELVEQLTPIITTIVNDIGSGFVAIKTDVEDAMSAIMAAMTEAWPYIQAVIETVMPIIGAAVIPMWNIIQAVIGGVMGAIKAVISTTWNIITSVISTAVGAISGIIGGLQGIVATVQGIFNAVKNAIMTPINTAKNLVRSAINTIKNIINGAHLKLPEIKLPHFNIDGGQVPWGIGGVGTPPKISIDWYAHGGIVDGPQLIGAGERGPELIWPSYDPYLSQYADAIASRIDGGGSMNVYINDVNVNDEAGVKEITADYLIGLRRLAAI